MLFSCRLPLPLSGSLQRTACGILARSSGSAASRLLHFPGHAYRSLPASVLHSDTATLLQHPNSRQVHPSIGTRVSPNWADWLHKNIHLNARMLCRLCAGLSHQTYNWEYSELSNNVSLRAKHLFVNCPHSLVRCWLHLGSSVIADVLKFKRRNDCMPPYVFCTVTLKPSKDIARLSRRLPTKSWALYLEERSFSTEWLLFKGSNLEKGNVPYLLVSSNRCFRRMGSSWFLESHFQLDSQDALKDPWVWNFWRR